MSKLNQVRIFDYDPSTGKWLDALSLLSREPEPFAEGGIRKAYRAFHCGKCRNWSDYPMVIKLVDDVKDRTRRLVENDVIMQWRCIEYANAYNAMPVTPKKVEYVPCQMVEFLSDREKGQFGSLERYLPGNYEKHSTANPFIPFALNDRNTPQAFSHFTFEKSGRKELVVDVQGVGDVYTDPQIYTVDSGQQKYGQANYGMNGIATFFIAHRCNDICRALNLTEIDPRLAKYDGTVPVRR